MNNSSNNIVINIISNDPIKEEYFKEFTIDELWKLNNFFKLFDNSEKIVIGLKEIFEKNIPIIKKTNVTLTIKIIPLIPVLEEIYLIIPKKNTDSFSIIEEISQFLNKKLNEIDPENELKKNRASYEIMKENILGRKIRIPLIGNISVGKSSVLNCIIGEKILPTKKDECTYRGVILRYKDDDDFKLYRTKLITKGNDFNQYSFFQEEKDYYCKGVSDIKDYLNNKNKDKKIADEDAYILITGKLKIFEFIKLEKEIINMIEFVDLPGEDNKNNTFKEGEYDEKILAFSNCCIYVNDPNTYLDSISHENMINRYRSDKEKVFITLRNDFIKTCIFLINKSDLLEEEDDNENQKKKIIDSLVKNIKAIENNITEENINYSFFSAQSFEYYLFIYKYYVQYFETNIFILLNYLYKEWKACKSYLLFKKYNFKDYIIKKNISVIEEKLNLEEQNEGEDEDEENNENSEKEDIKENNEIKEIDQKKIPDKICQQFKEAINIIFKDEKKEISETDKNEILKHLYQLYNKIRNNNFDKTIYSWSFFNKLKEVILFSQNLYNKNFKNSMADFFWNLDFLFMKKINETHQKYENFDIIIQKIKDLFEQKGKKFSDILKYAKNNSIQLIDDEINNIKDRLIKIDYDLDKALEILYEKLNNIAKDTNEKIQNENQSFTKEIEDLVGEIEKNLIQSLSLDISGISTIKPIVNSFFASFLLFKGGGMAWDWLWKKFGIDRVAEAAWEYCHPLSLVETGVITPIPSFLTPIGTLLTNPITTALIIGVSLVPIGYSIYKNVFDKEGKYKKKLEQTKKDTKNRYNDMMKSLGKDLIAFKNNVINNIEKRAETLKKKIKNVDEIKWKKMQEDYFKFKDNIKNKIEYLIGN